MGKFSKKPKSYYYNSMKHNNQNQRQLQPNMTGFLCTCLGNEKKCAKEAINLLNEFADFLYGKVEDPQKISKGIVSNDSSSEESDIESELKKELEDIKKPKEDASKARFYEARVSVNNCVFIACSIDNPVDISLAIMNRIIESKSSLTNSVIRLTPVQITCKAFIENIEKAAQGIILKYLPKDIIMSFCIIVNIRNNNAVKKEELVPKLSLFACNHNNRLRVNTRTPDVVLHIDILKKICCLAFLPEYLTKYHKYNMNKIATVAALEPTEATINPQPKALEEPIINPVLPVTEDKVIEEQIITAEKPITIL